MLQGAEHANAVDAQRQLAQGDVPAIDAQTVDA